MAKGTNGAAYTLVWDCTAGTFDWFYDLDETIHVLEGSALIGQDGGPARRVGPGGLVFFPRGSSARWVVDSYVRKLAFFNHPPPRLIGLALRAAGRIGSALRASPRPGARASAAGMPVAPGR